MPGVTPRKAKKILSDGSVHGKKLTPKQRRYMASRADDVREEAVRKATS